MLCRTSYTISNRLTIAPGLRVREVAAWILAGNARDDQHHERDDAQMEAGAVEPDFARRICIHVGRDLSCLARFRGDVVLRGRAGRGVNGGGVCAAAPTAGAHLTCEFRFTVGMAAGSFQGSYMHESKKIQPQ
jgi:hypothetical protein